MMINFNKPTALISLLFALAFTNQAFAFSMERYIEGQHYKVIENAELRPKTIIEFFSYGCPHCYHLEPELEQWLHNSKPKDVTFERVPAAWNKRFQVLAQLYYALESLGQAEALSNTIFEALHEHNKTIAGYQDAETLLKDKGLEIEKFKSAWNSDEVGEKVRFANTIFAQHQVRGVPAVLVNGKFLTNVSMAGSEKELFEVISFLLQKS